MVLSLAFSGWIPTALYMGKADKITNYQEKQAKTQHQDLYCCNRQWNTNAKEFESSVKILQRNAQLHKTYVFHDTQGTWGLGFLSSALLLLFRRSSIHITSKLHGKQWCSSYQLSEHKTCVWHRKQAHLPYFSHWTFLIHTTRPTELLPKIKVH